MNATQERRRSVWLVSDSPLSVTAFQALAKVGLGPDLFVTEVVSLGVEGGYVQGKLRDAWV